MPTSSITHNFVIKDVTSAKRFIEALDKPGIQRSNIKVESVSGDGNVRLLMERWKKSIK